MMWSISRQHTFKALCLVSLLAACSDDPKDPKQTPVVIDDGVDMSVDQDAQTTEDMNDEPDFVRQEVEPNDSPSAATSLKLGEYFSGTISESTQNAWDVDHFKVQGDRNTLLTVELQKVGPGFDAGGKKGLLITIENSLRTVRWFHVVQHSSKRTIYLPSTDTYTIAIQQLETKLDSSNPPHGGDDYTYQGLITLSPVTPTEEAFPLDSLIQRDLEDGAADIYPLEVDEVTYFQLFAKAKKNLETQEQPRVYAQIWDATSNGPQGSSPQIQAQWTNDKLDYDDSYVNIADLRLQPGRYYVMVDTQLNAKIPSYELMLRKLDGVAAAPRDLPVDEPYESSIAAPFPYRNDTDIDYFRIELQPKTQAHISLRTPLQSSLKPRVYIFEGAGDTLQPSTVQTKGTLDFDVVNPTGSPQQYIIKLAHDPNLIVQDGQRGEGGDGYAYTLTRADSPLDFQRIPYKHVLYSATFDIPKYLWFQLPATSPNELWSLSAFSLVNYTALVDDHASFIYGATSKQTAITSASGFGGLPDLLIGLMPQGWILSEYNPFNLLYLSVDLTDVTYTEEPQLMPGLTPQEAPLLALDTPISSTFRIADESHFYKVFLSKGEGLAIITEPSTEPGAARVPTEINILNEAGQSLRAQSGIVSAKPEDRVATSRLGLQVNLYSSYAALPYHAETDETITIEISGRLVLGRVIPGDFVLKLARVAVEPRPLAD